MSGHSGVTRLRGSVTQSKIIERDGAYFVQAVVRTAKFPVVCMWKAASRHEAELHIRSTVSVTGELLHEAGRYSMIQPFVVPIIADVKKPRRLLKKLTLAAAAVVVGLVGIGSLHPEPVEVLSAAKTSHVTAVSKPSVQPGGVDDAAADAVHPATVPSTTTAVAVKSVTVIASPAKPPVSSPALTQAAAKAVVSTPNDCDLQTIPFTTTTKQDATLAGGTSRITTAGINGSRKVCYPNGRAKPPVTTIVAQPVTQVTTVGTHVASTSVSATTVTSTSSAASVGATALCNDGTYSHSAAHTGNCTRHDGVAHWL